MLPAVAAAQTGPQPIPRFAADVRVSIPRFKAGPAIAAPLAVTVEDLPTRGLGVVVGAHLYLLRTRAVTFGFGAEILRGGARRTRPAAEEGGQEGPTVETRLSAISPQLSFNFGHRDGWSYISGGLGSATLVSEIEVEGLGAEDPTSKTINYGGGARWFTTRHLAVSLDLRFYAVSPRTATAASPGYPRMTVMVFSGGIAFR
jgi:hypothetical protein